MVLIDGRTRVWVEQGALWWKQGRTTAVVPGEQIRRVETAGRSLTVLLFDGAEAGQADAVLSARHRNEVVVAALGAEIKAIMGDGAPLQGRPPLRRHSVSPWPRRLLAGLRDRVLHGSPWWRRTLWYVVLGLPLSVLLPLQPRYLGFVAWLLLPAGVALLRLWLSMAGLDTRWVMWRRGITVRARYETTGFGEDRTTEVRFRTLDGQDVLAFPESRGWRDEVRYDPKDPSRVLAPTRVAWLGLAVVAFCLTGLWGTLCTVPALVWVIELATLPFSMAS